MFFFFGVKKFTGVKALFLGFFGFFHGQNWLFTPVFFRILSFFHARIFFFTRVCFGFFHGRENRVSRAKLSNLTGVFTIFFHVYQFFFHVCDLPKNSRAKTDFHVQF